MGNLFRGVQFDAVDTDGPESKDQNAEVHLCGSPPTLFRISHQYNIYMDSSLII